MIKLGLGGILFTSETDAQNEQDGLIQMASETSVKILMVPSIDEVNGSNLLHYRVRQVKIEDLLGRPEIEISLKEIKENFRDRVIMVTGAAGSIGSELCRQLAGYGLKQLVLFDNAETPMHNIRLELEDTFKGLNFVPVIGDVRNTKRLDFVFRKYRPSVVFHAAAYKHVPLMEENPCEAVMVNVVGSKKVADKCLEYGVDMMVMISTDKAVNPTNIMGCSKRLAEIYVQSLGLALSEGKVKGHTKFVTTRFGKDAAEMQLTAIYKSPSEDDLFMELDFHLLNIEIDELIELIPSVDSIMPMLKSFDGRAQFHLAVETGLKADYYPKMSTLIGAAAIEGQNLKVIDNEVFDGIKRKLLMSKDATGIIDSLDVEVQVLRNKVDVYPFRIKMDRYQAVIGGRHNINKDLDCGYHISLTDSPLPFRLGVDITGPITGIAESPLKHISLVRPKYKKLYKPEKRGDTEEKVLKMKQDILETLRSNVR